MRRSVRAPSCIFWKAWRPTGPSCISCLRGLGGAACGPTAAVGLPPRCCSCACCVTVAAAAVAALDGEKEVRLPCTAPAMVRVEEARDCSCLSAGSPKWWLRASSAGCPTAAALTLTTLYAAAAC